MTKIEEYISSLAKEVEESKKAKNNKGLNHVAEKKHQYAIAKSIAESFLLRKKVDELSIEELRENVYHLYNMGDNDIIITHLISVIKNSQNEIKRKLLIKDELEDAKSLLKVIDNINNIKDCFEYHELVIRFNERLDSMNKLAHYRNIEINSNYPVSKKERKKLEKEKKRIQQTGFNYDSYLPVFWKKSSAFAETAERLFAKTIENVHLKEDVNQNICQMFLELVSQLTKNDSLSKFISNFDLLLLQLKQKIQNMYGLDKYIDDWIKNETYPRPLEKISSDLNNINNEIDQLNKMIEVSNYLLANMGITIEDQRVYEKVYDAILLDNISLEQFNDFKLTLKKPNKKHVSD